MDTYLTRVSSYEMNLNKDSSFYLKLISESKIQHIVQLNDK